MLSRIGRHALCLTLPLLLVCLMPARANAWGPAGHRIVALVATKHLTARARDQVRGLLGDESLADVANWADDVRNERPNTAKWHFVNLPRNATALNLATDCPAAGTSVPGCAVAAIEMFRDILSGARPGDKAEALKFLVHFVGDLHQPLHVSFKEDKGGNDIDVLFFNKRSNLHKVWDSGIIRRAELSDEEFAAELEAALWEDTDSAGVEQLIKMLEGGTTDNWANESFALAKGNAYHGVNRKPKPMSRLGVAYYENDPPGPKKPNWKVVDDQLTRAGLRLARLLNDALR